MTRNLKALFVAMLALCVLGATAASAYAVEEFTAPGAAAGAETKIDSEKDEFEGNAKTAHQVIDFRRADGTGVLSITCNEAFWTNAKIVGPKTTEITTTVDFRGSSTSAICNFDGQSVLLNNGDCDFNFTANGTVHIADDGTQTAGNHCMHGEKPITFESSVLKCKIEIGTQTTVGVKYHNIEEVKGSGIKTLTLEVTNLPFEYNATGTGCPYGTTINGIITTGNTILRGTRPAGTFVSIEWHT